MAGLVSYGGDPRVVASRAEIERVSGHLGTVSSRALTQLLDLLSNPIHQAQFAFQLPELEVRLTKVRVALAAAAEGYFTTEARVAHQLDQVGHVIRDHPWLLNLIPAGMRDKLIASGVAAVGLSVFAPGNTGARSVRLLSATQDLNQRVASVQQLGLLHDKKVAISGVRATSGGVGARNLADIANRIDQTQQAKSEVRIEKYEAANGRQTFVLYLPGTQSGKDNPFDFTSDAVLATDAKHSELAKAVRAALAEAGVTSSSNLVVAGYSLGGMLGSSIAADPNYNVTGFVSLGAPIASASIGQGIPVLAIEHSNDPVPVVSGETNPLTENWVTASREVNLGPAEIALNAHSLSEYQESAKLADHSSDYGLTRVREAILGQLKSSQLVETTSFELRR